MACEVKEATEQDVWCRPINHDSGVERGDGWELPDPIALDPTGHSAEGGGSRSG